MFASQTKFYCGYEYCGTNCGYEYFKPKLYARHLLVLWIEVGFWRKLLKSDFLLSIHLWCIKIYFNQPFTGVKPLKQRIFSIFNWLTEGAAYFSSSRDRKLAYSKSYFLHFVQVSKFETKQEYSFLFFCFQTGN